ncbi:MAG: hypothetical protein RLZZ387_983 [Chloroflexota bacterium]|jgi:hypothetical protein
MRSRTLALITALALLAGLWVSATSRAEEAPAEPKTLRPQAAGDARVRIVHASADAPAVDVYIGTTPTEPVLRNVPFGAVSDYLDVAPGANVRIRVVPAGGLLGSAVIDTTAALTAGEYYTVAACRPLASIGTPCVTADSFGTPIAAGEARVRVFHYSPDAPSPVDVTADGVGVIVDDLAYLASPATVDVPAQSYNLSLTNATNTAVAAILRDVQLLPGRIYDLFAAGSVSGGTFKLISTISDPRAKVRVVHAAVGAPAVDVFVGGSRALSDISFFQASDYLPVTPGAGIPVFVAAAGTSTPLLPAVNLTFEPGKAYTVVARGTTADIATLGYELLLDDMAAPAAGRAKVRAIHLSPDAPAVSLRANGLVLPVPALSFGQASSYIDVPVGTYTVEAVVASGPSAGAVALSANQLRLEAGKIYDVFAVGTLAQIHPEIRVTDTMARVRVVHASPTAGPVDVYVDGVRVLSAVTVGRVSEYLRVMPGLRRVQVVAPTSGDPATASVIDATLSFETGDSYTVAARNQGSSVVPTVFTDDQGIAATGRAKVRVYHLSAAAPTVDVRVAGTTTPLIDNLAPGTASATHELAAGSYNLEVTSSNGAAVLLTVPNVQANASINYDLFALDAPQPTIVTAVSLGSDVPIYPVYLPVISR